MRHKRFKRFISQNHRHINALIRAIIIAACLFIAAGAFVPASAALLFQGNRAPKADVWQYVDDADLRAVSERTIIPNQYRTLRLDMGALKHLLASAPMEFTEEAKSSAVEVSLPMPDGTMARFKAVESPIMEPELAAAFPENKTYSGHGIDDPTASCRFDVTPSGFHAYIFSREGSIFITPYARGNGEHYLSYYRRDSREEERKFRCYVKEVGAPSRPIAPQSLFWWGAIRTYRYAAAATGEYTEFFRFPGDTDDMAKARVFDNILTNINGVNAIFVREVGIRLILIDNRSIIYTSPEDPYTSGNKDSLIEENQENLDNVIGEDNYDIGQVFDVEGGGLAAVASVCDNDNKGRGMTGNDIVVTAHETAHQFSAHHTFNDNANGSCAGDQYAGDSAYEPGSGSTIMSYCGNCSAANLQPSRDLYFHAKSILVMRDYIVNDDGEGCAQFVSTPNLGVELFLNQTHTIPAQTPFRLYGGDFNDPDPGDAILYCWEEYDLGDASPPEGDNGSRPIFRSYMPSLNPDRIFPSLPYVLNNGIIPTTYNCGTPANPVNCLTGEAWPTTTRTMSFALTLRDNVDAAAIDHLTVNVVSDSVPFLVMTPLTAVVWPQGSPRTVTWTAGNSNQPPINCANVKITLSTDGGNTFPIVLAESTPNDGTETITVPQVDTNQARVKVEAVGNIFFNVSSGNFTIRPPMVTTTDDGTGDNLSPISGSLREALIAANNLNPIGGDPIPILFNIPGGATLKTINVVKELPQITKPVFLEGHSQGGAGYGGPPLIEISGAFAAPPPGQTMVSGLRVAPSGAGSRLKGLTVNRFTGSGIEISGGMSVIDECYIGTDAAGAAAAGNAQAGVAIIGCSGNLLFHNLISGNDVGVQITGATATGNLLRLNSIGTDVNRTARIPNASDGIRITGSPGNTIGGLLGSGDSGGNVISGNGKTFSVTGVLTFADGIEISGATASGNIIEGNRIGLDESGTFGLDNTADCIHIIDAPNTIIRGTIAAGPNVIGGSGVLTSFGANGIEISGATASGTVIRGNLIGTDSLGTANLGNRGSGIYIDNAPNTIIGGTSTLDRNVISGSKNAGGIRIGGATATGTVVQGNFIGTNAAGTAAIPNNAAGIRIESANNLIGGTTPGARNIISGNTNGDGIILSESGAGGNTIQGNYIGTDVTGTADLGNTIAGIRITRASNNLIGGTTPAARNVISGNNNYGVLLFGVSGGGANNRIQGNYIGTDVTGNNALGNGLGVRMEDASNNTLGGTTPGAGNVISANNGLGLGGSPGVLIFSGVPVTGIKVQGNYIGTNAAGTSPLGNLGNGISISLTGNSSVTIGGSAPGARNIISANSLDGIGFNGSVVTIQGNYIGTDVTGTANLGNAESGIEVSGGTGNMIGGAGAGNVIAFNGAPGTGFFHAGVQVFSTGNSIRGNSIFSNTGLGIDLNSGGGGVTANDNCDADGGPNNLQNFPVLISANNGVGSVAIEGTLNSTASSAFTLDFYASPACDASGNGEGKTYLGSAGVTTAANCTASFTAENAIVLVNVTVPAGQVITATATDAAGNTSELSACILVTGLCGALSPANQSFGAMGGSGSVMVNAAAGCGWTAVSNDSWIVIVSDASGAGDGVVQFEVRQNFAAESRTGTMTIAQQVFTVKQTGACSYSINPTLQTFASGGGNGQFSVTTQNGCSWMAVSDSNWITVTAGMGVGNGTVSYTVAANPGPGGRTGTITAGGRVFTVKQKAP